MPSKADEPPAHVLWRKITGLMNAINRHLIIPPVPAGPVRFISGPATLRWIASCSSPPLSLSVRSVMSVIVNKIRIVRKIVCNEHPDRAVHVRFFGDKDLFAGRLQIIVQHPAHAVRDNHRTV